MPAKQRRIDRATILVRVPFGDVWLVDAYLKRLPAFRAHDLDLMADAAKEQPAWRVPWSHFWPGLYSLHSTVFGSLLPLGETYIAPAMVLGFARTVTYLLGAIWSILVRATAEGFGRPNMGPRTDSGMAIIYAVVFLTLLALDARFGTGAHSLDVILERWRPWWRRTAEVGR